MPVQLLLLLILTRAGPMGTTIITITMVTHPTTTGAATTASRITTMTLIAVIRSPTGGLLLHLHISGKAAANHRHHRIMLTTIPIMEWNGSRPKLPPVGLVGPAVSTLAIPGMMSTSSSARLLTKSAILEEAHESSFCSTNNSILQFYFHRG